MAVVQPCALDGTDAVSIVTCRARNLLLEMILVLGEAFVIENAVSTMTAVAERIIRWAFRRVVDSYIVTRQDGLECGAVGAFRARTTDAPCLV